MLPLLGLEANLTLPEAILALKQGVGRLIRIEADRGVITSLPGGRGG